MSSGHRALRCRFPIGIWLPVVPLAAMLLQHTDGVFKPLATMFVDYVIDQYGKCEEPLAGGCRIVANQEQGLAKRSAGASSYVVVRWDLVLQSIGMG